MRHHLPQDTLAKLHRVADPNLSFEEHQDIFPLDLGPIWDLEVFSRGKILKENPFDEQTTKLIYFEWGSILEQFSSVLGQALEGKGLPLIPVSGEFLFRQSLVEPGKKQIDFPLHADGSRTTACFKEEWEPPTQLILVARDISPTTVFVKGTREIPWNLVDSKATQKAQQKLLEDIEVLQQYFPGKNLDKRVIPHRLVFRDQEMTERARAEGRLVVAPEGHVVAFTDRCLHAGQPATSRVTQTWARVEVNLRSVRYG